MPAKFTQVERTCATCGAAFFIHLSRLKRPRQSEALYCSLKCLGASRHRSLEKSFWEKVDRTGPCWLWVAGRKVSGHGSFYVGKRPSGTPIMQQAHRFAWTLLRGPIPPGMMVCHDCRSHGQSEDNPHCVNPEHLFLGTQAENVRDAQRKGRFNVPKRRHR
jgi:HNH endonuclease